MILRKRKGERQDEQILGRKRLRNVILQRKTRKQVISVPRLVENRRLSNSLASSRSVHHRYNLRRRNAQQTEEMVMEHRGISKTHRSKNKLKVVNVRGASDKQVNYQKTITKYAMPLTQLKRTDASKQKVLGRKTVSNRMSADSSKSSSSSKRAVQRLTSKKLRPFRKVKLIVTKNSEQSGSAPKGASEEPVPSTSTSVPKHPKRARIQDRNVGQTHPSSGAERRPTRSGAAASNGPDLDTDSRKNSSVDKNSSFPVRQQAETGSSVQTLPSSGAEKRRTRSGAAASVGLDLNTDSRKRKNSSVDKNSTLPVRQQAETDSSVQTLPSSGAERRQTRSGAAASVVLDLNTDSRKNSSVDKNSTLPVRQQAETCSVQRPIGFLSRMSPNSAKSKHSSTGNSTQVSSATSLRQSSPVASTSTQPVTSHRQASSSPVTDYQYPRLADLPKHVPERVNIYGVVEHFKPASKTRGNDFMMLLILRDESLPAHGFRCLLFASEADKLPKVRAVGDIIRLHRIKLIQHGETLYGQSSPGWSALVFPKNGGNHPVSTSQNFTFTEKDVRKISRLRKMPLSLSSVEDTISNIRHGSYVDIICQVLGVKIISNDRAAVRVWDGTKPSHDCQIYGVSMDGVPNEILEAAQGRMIDVLVFDDHKTEAESLNPGRVIKLVNVWADNGRINSEDFGFIMRGGISYGRGIKLLDSDSSEYESLLERIVQVVDDA